MGTQAALADGLPADSRSKRRLTGQKCSDEMLMLALEYCFRIMRADKVTIGVFEKNAAAYGCYRSVGFHESTDRKGSEETFNGTVYQIAELDITKEEYAERNPEYHI